MKKIMLFAALSALAQLAVAELAFTKGAWTLKVDKASGALVQVNWNNCCISNNPAKIPLINWGPKWIAGTSSAPVKLLSHSWDEKKGILTLNTQAGDYKISETLALGYNGDKDFLSVGVAFTYAPKDPKSEFVKFNRFTCSFPITSNGKYLLAGKENLSTPERSGSFSDIRPGGGVNAGWGVPPALVEIAQDRTLVFMPEYRNDIAGFRVDKSKDGSVYARVTSAAAGWAYAGKPQHIGPFYLKVYPGPIREAFEKAIHPMYDTINLKAVNDTPAWFQDAVIYSFCAGGTVSSAGKDLGGFTPSREELLPRVKSLGFTTFWMLPIEDGNGNRTYWPRDYYKVNSLFGTSDELKALVDAIHAAGMRVLFDSVPHGGTPANGVLRGNKPWHLAFNEKGIPAGYWCYDFGDPEWQKYVAAAAAYHMKKYGIDGYRIDAVIGNHYLNWRRADFPAKCPPNVDKVWWEKSLKENGGRLPPLPYERASLGCRQGGLEMLKGIRNAVESNKKDGVILAEVDHAPYMQDADAIFNFPLASTVRKTATRMPAAEWAEKLTRWLDDGNFIYPRNSRWMQYFGSHDHPNPYGYLGIGITRTLFGYAMMLKGIPMIYHDQDIGIGVFLKRIIAIRKALPELCRGSARYNSPAPEVLAALRTYEDKIAIGLANIAADPVDVLLADAVPEKLSAKGKYTLWSSDSATPLGTGTVDELLKKRVKLRPYSNVVYAFRSVGQASPFPAETAFQPAKTKAKSAFDFKETSDAVEVQAPQYTLSISRETGMISSFTGISGKKLLSGAGFIIEADPVLRQKPAVCKLAVRTHRETKGIRITATGKLNGSPVTLEYFCTPAKVTVTGSLENGDALPRAGFYLKGSQIDRWQAVTSEGLLDDYFAVRHAKGTPNNKMAEGYINYRLQGLPVVWEADINPLSFNQPEITAFSGGDGVGLTFLNLLKQTPDNIAVLDKLGGENGWHTAIYWKELSLFPAKKVTAGRSFSFDLKPTAKPLKTAETTPWTQVGKVKFRNISRGWEVDNGIYRMFLSRNGGSIRQLRGKSGAELISQSKVFTNKGFRRLHGGKNMHAASDNDGEGEVTIQEKNGKLCMRFDFAMRGDGRIAIIVPNIWGSMEYTFDETADIGIKWSVVSDGAPKDDPAFLGLEFSNDNWYNGRFWKGGKEYGRHTWQDNRKLAGKALPDRVDFCGTDGRVLFELNRITYPADAPHPSVVKMDKKFRMAPIDGDSAKLRPGQRYEYSMTLTVKQ